MKSIKIICIAFLLLLSFKSYSILHVVNQTGFSFSPKNLTVTVGDVIRWVWSSGSHTTTSTSIPVGAQTWDAQLTSSTTSFDYTVTVVGSYSYVCTPHESMGMVGSFTAVVSTAVDGNSLLNDFIIYPNPASSFINISLGVSGEVVLSDILGKKLKKFRLNEPSVNMDYYRLDLADLADGIYILSLTPSDNRKRISIKLLKE